MTQLKSGRLTVLSEEVRQFPCGKRRMRCYCQCECGTKKWVDKLSVVKGSTKSCGCLIKEVATKHGMTKTRVYKAWRGILGRCLNLNSKDSRNYADRGITVLPEWIKFETFYEYLKTLLPSGHIDIPKGLSIDRIDNNRGYEPGNIRLATAVVQGRNRRTNHLIEIDGITRCLAEWAELYGIGYTTIDERIKSGWNPADAVKTPARPKKPAKPASECWPGFVRERARA